MLSVDTYNLAEKEARETMPNRIIEAGTPATFALRGYPTVINSDKKLLRYVDAMHELGEEDIFRGELCGLTQEEFDLFRQISKVVAEFTEDRFGHRTIPKGGLVRAVLSYRHIRFISPPETTTVFEIGPGSGYLGALLALAGYRYAATDVTQAFYIFQSNLWGHLFGDRVVELAAAQENLEDFEELPPGTVLHVPWWKFNVPNPEDIRLKIDVATANHSLCEMQDTAFRYALRLFHACLGGPEGLKYFFIEGPGLDSMRTYQQMLEGFAAADYVSVFKEFPIDVFAPAAHGDALYEAASGEDSPADRISSVESRIVNGRQGLEEQKRVSFEEMRAFQSELMGGADILNDDEKFLRFAYNTDNWS